jgi:carboxymethylenebutenolidase
MALEVREWIESFTHDGAQIAVERFAPPRRGRHVAILLLHGRDGLERGGLHYRTLAHLLAADGFAVFLIDYFGSFSSIKSPSDPRQFLGWVERIGEAIRHAVSQPDVERDRVGLVGVSLGGYLAMTVAAREPAIKAVVECSGGIPEVIAHQVEHLPPVLILHGEVDVIVPVYEAQYLAKLLKTKNLPFEQVIYPREGHLFSPITTLDAMTRTVAFLRKHLG